MQRASGKSLEERLTAYGKSLLDPPTSNDELLKLLDKIEKQLSKVEQSPTKSMQAALSPLMNALIADALLKHSDVDVRVGIASCISEITRITAPDAPYDDAKMKVVFQLIVSSFENLSDVSSRSYQQRVSILETVAKVRSCVIMLDLECDKMILEMFNHFFKAIRQHHEGVIFVSMENIMTLVFEESEEMSADLISLILSVLRRDNEDNPSAKKLAESVIRISSEKLRPYITEAVKSLNSSFEDYSEAVALICTGNLSAVEHSNESIVKDQTEDGSAESNQLHKNHACNGSKETVNKAAKAANSSKTGKKPDGQRLPSNSVTVPTGVKSSQDGKSIALVKDSDTTSASRASANEAADVTSPTRGSISNESHSAKKRISGDTGLQKASEGDTLSVGKHRKSSQRKQGGEASKSDDGSASNSGAVSVDQKIGTSSEKFDGGSMSKKEDGRENGSGAASGAPSETVVPKRGRGRPRLEKPKSSTKEDHAKEKSSPRSLPILKKDEATHERTPRISSKGKQSIETDKGSESIEYGENLVGSKIRVWWPKDQMFYEGVVSSFDVSKKKHKVLYTDGDMEILNLQKQKWEYVKYEQSSDEEQDVERSSQDAPDTRSKRKKGTNSDTSNKRRKSEDSQKSEDTNSLTQDMETGPDAKSNKSKSGKKSPNDATKSQDGSKKQDSKLEGSAASTFIRSNDDSPRTPSNQKQDNKSERKRGRPPGSSNKKKNSSTSNVKATDKTKGKADLERSSEKVKGKSPNTSTLEVKSSKKRR